MEAAVLITSGRGTRRTIRETLSERNFNASKSNLLSQLCLGITTFFISALTRRKFHRCKSNVMAAACENAQNSLERVYKSPPRPGRQRNTPPTSVLLGHRDAGVTPAQLLPHRLPAAELLPSAAGARPHLSPRAPQPPHGPVPTR